MTNIEKVLKDFESIDFDNIDTFPRDITFLIIKNFNIEKTISILSEISERLNKELNFKL